MPNLLKPLNNLGLSTFETKIYIYLLNRMLALYDFGDEFSIESAKFQINLLCCAIQGNFDTKNLITDVSTAFKKHFVTLRNSDYDQSKLDSKMNEWYKHCISDGKTLVESDEVIIDAFCELQISEATKHLGIPYLSESNLKTLIKIKEQAIENNLSSIASKSRISPSF